MLAYAHQGPDGFSKFMSTGGCQGGEYRNYVCKSSVVLGNEIVGATAVSLRGALFCHVHAVRSAVITFGRLELFWADCK